MTMVRHAVIVESLPAGLNTGDLAQGISARSREARLRRCRTHAAAQERRFLQALSPTGRNRQTRLGSVTRVAPIPSGWNPSCRSAARPTCSGASSQRSGWPPAAAGRAVPFPSTTGGIHHRNPLDRLSQSPRPDLPTGSTAGASLEATGDSVHLALVLRESRLGELAITLTELALRERDIRNFDG